MTEEPVAVEDALIYAMILMSASDGDMSDVEIDTILDVVERFPALAGFDRGRMQNVIGRCAIIMGEEDGLRHVLRVIDQSIPDHLAETVYAAAVEVAAADEYLNAPELRVLELLKDGLGISDEGAQAIEHSARVRHQPLVEAPAA